MIHIPYKIQPSNVTPFDVRKVHCCDPRKRGAYMEFPITTFFYEENGKFKAWTGLDIHELAAKGTILARVLKGRDSRVFNGYIAPMTLLNMTVYEMTKEDVTVMAESLEAVQNMVYDLTKACAKFQRHIDECLERKAENDAAAARYAEWKAKQQEELRDVCDIVYPDRGPGAYQGD